MSETQPLYDTGPVRNAMATLENDLLWLLRRWELNNPGLQVIKVDLYRQPGVDQTTMLSVGVGLHSTAATS